MSERSGAHGDRASASEPGADGVRGRSPRAGTASRQGVHPRAIALGAAVVLAVAVPVAAIGSALLDDGSDAVFALALLALAAIGAGGWVAGREAPAAPLLHGALAALAGFAIAQAVSIALQVAGDDDVNLAAFAFNALLAANAGLVGGWLSTRRRLV